MIDANDLANLISKQIKESGRSTAYEKLLSLDFKYSPCSPREFLFDDYFLGRYCSGKNGSGKLYSKWIDVLLEVLEPSNNYYELILTGGIGVGKSTVSAIAMLYRLYRISVLKDPSAFYNLMPDSPIVFASYNIFKYKAEDNYNNIKTFVENSPYFKEHFPTNKMRNKNASEGLNFSNRIKVIKGATDLHALGLNLLGLILDEANFFKGDSKSKKDREESRSQAHKLYEASRRRITSRFMYAGMIPGLMILISSRNTDTSWLERHLSEVHNRDGVFVADFPLWEVKKDVAGYCGEMFSVEVGDQFNSSRILSEHDIPRKGSKVIEIPIEHKLDFVNDLDSSLRDIAGISSLSHAPLIRYREHITSCISSTLSHPFTKESFSISTEDKIEIKDYLSLSKLVTIKNSYPRPRLSPAAIRAVHIDLGLTHDSASIVCGFVDKIIGTKPSITIDFFIRLLAPKKGQIDFSKIRDFLVYLRSDLGFPIKIVTLDSFQSFDTMQVLKKLSFDCSILSLDRDDHAYLVARSMIYEHRVSFYEYKPFIEELVNLQHDLALNKVDHPKHGSKDCSDSFAGVIFTLSNRIGKDKALRRTDDISLLPINNEDDIKEARDIKEYNVRLIEAMKAR